MADLVVDRLEVVDVDDDQRELPLVPLCARDLARQRLVKEAAIVQAGQRVEVRQLPRLAEPARVLDRGAGTSRERLELADLVLAESVLGVAREDGQVADRLAFAGQRNREGSVDDRVLWPPLALRIR